VSVLKHHAKGEVEVKIHTLLNRAVDRGEWSASRPVRFTHWMEGWMVLRANLDAAKAKNTFPALPGIKPQSPSP
jgi:hypothetical protein